MNDASLEERLTLLELLDRVLEKGVVLSGDITLSVADVDLVYIGLRVLLSSVETAQQGATAQQRLAEVDGDRQPGISLQQEDPLS